MTDYRKAALVLMLILCSVMVIFPNLELVRANEPPFFNFEHTKAKVTTWHAPADAITEPTTIIIVSPEENRNYTINNVTLKVNVGVQPIYERGGDTHYIRSASYKADWMEASERIFYHLADSLMAKKITLTLNLSEITDGDHTLTVYTCDSYDVETPQTVNFTVNNQPQEISIPEFPSWTILLLMLIVVMILSAIYRHSFKPKQET
jgi:hypothetical protein